MKPKFDPNEFLKSVKLRNGTIPELCEAHLHEDLLSALRRGELSEGEYDLVLEELDVRPCDVQYIIEGGYAVLRELQRDCV